MTEPYERTPPEILSEEDEPFTQNPREDCRDNHLAREVSTDPLRKSKFKLGSNTLGWCIALMFGCVIISIFKPDNEMVANGFEAFKLIVMTILGYLFGSSKN